MIDTKIACQCGNRFKFGMDLVNGRAPDGLVCPTCGAPATAACNALLDFLGGQEPAPASAASRPIKEIKVTCTCGARYKFDLELAEREMPAPVSCPGCQVDLTPLANEEIRSYPAKHAPSLTAPVAAPAPAPVATPVTTEPPAQPPAADPAPPIAPAPVTPPPAAPPAEPVLPGASSAAISDPFGPAPTGKPSGPNLKPLEVPKHTRPAPGSKPATPPAKPAAHSTHAPGHSAAAHTNKPGAAKPAAKPAKTSGQPNLGLGIAGAAVGSILGAVIWFFVLNATASTAAWMAIVLGVLAGFGARLLGRTAAPVLGGSACVCATVAISVMAMQSMNAFIDRQLAPQMKSQYDQALASAQAAIKATDAELKVIIARSSPSMSMDGTVNVSDEDVRKYRAAKLPELRDLAAGKPSREAWQASKIAAARKHYPFEDAWQESIGIFGLLFFLAGILAAAKIPMK